MADKESILQLGIEAARAGDKEEARKFFRLLTRENPQDSQAWLWLAGVAEDREEKRAALEMVTQLDPNNNLAQKSLAALGGPPSVAPVVPVAPEPEPEPVQDYSSSFDDFDVDWDQTRTTEPAVSSFDDWDQTRTTDPGATRVLADEPAYDDDVSFMAPEPTRTAEPARTRELTPEEEWAMSLDSLGTASTAMNARDKGGSVDFDIPDFGEDLDLDAYMNRERVDASTIELTAEEAKAPVRKPLTRGGISDQAKSRTKDRNRPAGATRASGGWLPLLLALLAFALLGWFVWWFLNRDAGPVAVGTTTAIPGTSVAQTTPGTSTTSLPGVVGGNETSQPYPVDPNQATPDPNQPTADPNQAPPATDATPVPVQPTSNVPVDPNLGGVQPQILPGDGSTPINVDNWFFTYGGGTLIGDGNAMNLQPQGRWVVVRLLMFDGTNEGRTIPNDLVVLKDDQGRVYRANPDASEAFFNITPGIYNIHQKQPAPTGFNFSVPLVFDVAPDATNLVLFSPLDTNNGFFVRENAN